MSSLLKSTVLSLGILAGTAAVALAQSVSALPPTTPETPASSASKIVPSAGNNAKWQEQHGQPTVNYEADKWQHPYSSKVGPQPGSHSSGTDVRYEATEGDKEPSRHPYTSNRGPRLN
jgi:hypothetical protein